jgi:uncharacterized protein with HEPN domain
MSAVDPDLLRLQHMLDYAREVVTFTAQASRTDLDTNLMLLRALSMSTGVIGEAASHLSESFRDAHPEIPWRKITTMRNFLFHEYFRVDPDILWNTATISVPELIPQLEALLAQADE